MISKSLKNKSDCTGCHACYNACPTGSITMQPDDEGFLYPQLNNNTCIECGECTLICPTGKIIEIKNTPEGYACINRNRDIRIKSSSGGIFTLLAESILEDCGVVLGVHFNKEFVAEHIDIKSKNDLYEIRGSKYVQSNVGKTFQKVKRYLKEDRAVLFSGTPCQINGLKSYLKKPYEKLTCIDFVCHGVPSPLVWSKYLTYQKNRKGSIIESITMRDKSKSWKEYGITITFQNGIKYHNVFHKDMFLKAFLKDICLRPSCYNCRYKSLHRQSDITLADFWGIDHIEPDMDDDIGTSLVIINTKKGEELFKEISNKAMIKKVDLNKSIEYNPSAVHSAIYNKNREYFFKEIQYKSFSKVVHKYCNDKILLRLKRRIKEILHIS